MTEDEVSWANNFLRLHHYYYHVRGQREKKGLDKAVESEEDRKDIADKTIRLKKNYKYRRGAVSAEVMGMDYPTTVGKPVMDNTKTLKTKKKLSEVMKANSVAFKHLTDVETEAMIGCF